MFEDLVESMQAVGVHPADSLPLHADGKLRRFRLDGDKPQTLNGYVTIFDNSDGSYGACFGSWKHGIKENWFSGKPRRELTLAERREYAQKMAEAREKQDAEQRQKHQAAAAKALQLWEQAAPAAPEHPYLVKKQVKPYHLRQLRESLLVPVCTVGGALIGLQFISADGSKRFLSGTASKANLCQIGTITDLVLIAEGYATAASLHAATGYPCAVSFSAGNLRPVAEAIQAQHPQTTIIICADADPVGMAAAQEAAESVNGFWVAPDDIFTEQEAPKNGS
ncbi:MAG: toprim domain-containing protein [Desulfuromonadaceae bacterium]|nr:toprim domain-containing protein [Desulfuromonadaceae bacterium]